MKTNLLSKTAAFAVAFAALATAEVKAVQFAGEINFNGDAALVGGTAATATGASFSDVSTTNTRTGAYLPIPNNTPATFNPITFGAVGTTGALAINPLWTLSYLGVTYAFNLSSVQINTYVGTQRLVEGIGTATITGFDPTPGTFSFSSSGKTSNVSFSASTTASPVPDGGATVALFGLSLLGLTGVRRFIK